MDIKFYNQLNLLDVFFDEKRNPKDGGYHPGPDGKRNSDVVRAKLLSAASFAAGSMALSSR
jgi:hypothetical protein